ncbi:hypothetical protein LXL04_024824 [Taraxacum kok-saghyz]
MEMDLCPKIRDRVYPAKGRLRNEGPTRIQDDNIRTAQQKEVRPCREVSRCSFNLCGGIPELILESRMPEWWFGDLVSVLKKQLSPVVRENVAKMANPEVSLNRIKI